MTAPYMHDGRFETLDEVIDHYSEGINPRASLPPGLVAPGFRLSRADKEALKAFLHTLTDNELAYDPKYSDPFIYEESE